MKQETQRARNKKQAAGFQMDGSTPSKRGLRQGPKGPCKPLQRFRKSSMLSWSSQAGWSCLRITPAYSHPNRALMSSSPSIFSDCTLEHTFSTHQGLEEVMRRELRGPEYCQPGLLCTRNLFCNFQTHPKLEGVPSWAQATIHTLKLWL